MKTKASAGREGWIFDEDRALRDLLDNIRVNDSDKNNRKVGVWFGHPDQELRQQSYPYITLDLIDISQEYERTERGYFKLEDYQVERLSSAMTQGLDPLDPTQATFVEMPIPVRLTYQISTWARNPRHDRQILDRMLRYGLTPMQGGILSVSDGTMRRLDVLDFQKRDMVESNKRLLSNAIIVGVSSEVPASQLWQAYKAMEVALSVSAYKGDVNMIEDTVLIEAPETP